MTRPPTEKQATVLAFCWGFYGENDQLPPCATIAAKFGWSSANSSHQMLEALSRRGLLKRNVLGKYKFTEAGRAYIIATLYSSTHQEAFKG